MKIQITSRAFTIVEMMVVVAVLGILVSITAFGYRGWQQGIEQRQLKSDLGMASAAMENAKNFGSNGYPTYIPSGFSPSPEVILTYIGGNSSSYCIQAQSVDNPSTMYYSDTTTGQLQPGACGAGYSIAAPSVSLTSPSSSSITASWASVTGATSYVVRYGTTSASNTASCSSSPCTISGLNAATDYLVNVTAASSVASATSSSAGIQTQSATPPAIPAPAGASVAFTTSRVKVGAEFVQRYVMTASGGACSVGTTEWKIGVTGGSSPSWSSWAWQSSNTKTSDLPENGIYSSTDVTIYAKPRCVSGASSTEGGTAAAYNGSGGGTGGSL